MFRQLAFGVASFAITATLFVVTSAHGLTLVA